MLKTRCISWSLVPLAFEWRRRLRRRKQIVFDKMQATTKAEALGLAAARAVHQTGDGCAVFLQQTRNHRRISASRAEQRLADGQPIAFRQGIGEAMGAGVNNFRVNRGVECFGKFFAVI